jgi:hypothetical protein
MPSHSHRTHLKYHVARVVHPKVFWRMARFAQLDRQTMLQDESASLGSDTAAW